MVCLKICFREDIREISDSAQANTAQSRTPRRLTLRGVGKLKGPQIQNSLTLRGVGLCAG